MHSVLLIVWCCLLTGHYEIGDVLTLEFLHVKLSQSIGPVGHWSGADRAWRAIARLHPTAPDNHPTCPTPPNRPNLPDTWPDMTDSLNLK